MLHSAAEWLGNVPAMLSPEDIMHRGCDERAVILFISLLCPRLLNFAYEGKAAHVIASWWKWKRVYMMTLEPGALRARVASHLTDIRVSERWLRLADRIHLIPMLQEQGRLASMTGRSADIWGRWNRLGMAATRIINIQRSVRSWQAARPIAHRRAEYRAARVIQARVRGVAVRSHLARCNAAAVVIQAVFRGHRARESLVRRHFAAATIQAMWRGWVQRLAYLERWHQVVLMQQYARGALVRLRLRRSVCAAVVIQCAWRSCHARTQFVGMRAAAIVVQSAYRGWSQRRWLSCCLYSTIRMQALVRGGLVRRRLAVETKAVTIIATMWRGVCVRREARLRSEAAVVLQRGWRAHHVRKTCALEAAMAIRIQRAWRAHSARKRAALEHASAVRIQVRVLRYVRSMRDVSSVLSTGLDACTLSALSIRVDTSNMCRADVCVCINLLPFCFDIMQGLSTLRSWLVRVQPYVHKALDVFLYKQRPPSECNVIS